MGIEGTFLNIVKAVYNNLVVNIIVSWKNLKSFPLRSDTIQGCPLSPFLLYIILEVFSIAIRQEKDNLFLEGVFPISSQEARDSFQKILGQLGQWFNMRAWKCFATQVPWCRYYMDHLDGTWAPRDVGDQTRIGCFQGMNINHCVIFMNSN